MTNYVKCSFSTNWNNKLSCDCFTTIRLYSKKFVVGQKYDVELKTKHLKIVECVAVKTMNIEDINDFIAMLDTGYDKEKCKELIRTMYKNLNLDWTTQRLVFVLFKTVK